MILQRPGPDFKCILDTDAVNDLLFSYVVSRLKFLLSEVKNRVGVVALSVFSASGLLFVCLSDRCCCYTLGFVLGNWVCPGASWFVKAVARLKIITITSHQ